MTDDKKVVLNDVIERLLYCEEYKSKLVEFNKQFDPHQKVRYTTKPKEFMFGLDKAIH